MTYTFRFVFQGLCAFVPLVGSDGSSKLEVLLVDARQSKKFGMVAVPPHVPHVVLEKSAGDFESIWDKPSDSSGKDFYKQFGKLDLARHDLTIVGGTGASGVAGFEQQLDVIPDVYKALGKDPKQYPTLGDVVADAVPGKTPPATIVARMVFDAGKVKTLPYPAKWIFVKTPTHATIGAAQPLARMLIVEVQTDQPTLTLQGTALDTNGDGIDQQITGVSGKTATVFIRNITKQAMDQPGDAGSLYPDTHFLWFYELLQEPVAEDERTLPEMVMPSGGTHLLTPSHPDCPMFRYNAVKL